MTKTFVAAAILQLVDEGKLKLEDPLAEWFPDFPSATDITVRELLSHTSGIYNYFESPKYNAQVYADPNRVWTIDEILALVNGKPSYCAPGTLLLVLEHQLRAARPHHRDDHRSTPARCPARPLLQAPGSTYTVFQPDQPTPADKADGYQMDSAGQLLRPDRQQQRAAHQLARHRWPGRRVRWPRRPQTWRPGRAPCTTAGCCRSTCSTRCSSGRVSTTTAWARAPRRSPGAGRWGTAAACAATRARCGTSRSRARPS